jgi:lysophospholipase L1-like esterase
MSSIASRRNARGFAVAFGLAFCGVLACGGSGDGGTPGTGGSSATGTAGTTGSAGSSGSAGTNGSAGTTGQGGSAGSAAGDAGSSGSAGTTGQGGSAGNVSTAGQGGSAGNATGTGGGNGGTTGSAGAGGAIGNGGRGGSTAGSGGGGMSGRGGGGGATGNGGRGGTAGTGGSTGQGGSGGSGGGGTQAWVGTWATGPQLTETTNNPPSPGLTNNTLRQFVFTSISGSQARLRLSNEFGNGSVTMNAVHVALPTTGNSINASSDKAVTFSGSASVTIAQNQAVFSDPFDFAVPALGRVAITIAFGSTPSNITGHPGSRTNSFIGTGNMVSAASISGAVMVEHWYYIVGLDVMAPAGTAAVVTLGDSITDGRGSTTDMNNRWPDDFSRRLSANAATMNKVAVLNQGIGGNAVLSGGLGPTAQARFTRDVLQMRGVKWLIMFEGVNDLGGSSNGASTAQQLETAFGSMADMAHAMGIKVYGATITPLGTTYFNTDREAGRQTFNTWVRGSNKFDAVVDLDMAVRNPSDATKMQSTYDSGDGLHPSVAGHQKMADTVDLALFANP